MTGPVTEPPPSGPGKGDGDDSDLYLASVGCEVIDPLTAWVEAVAAKAPPLTDAQGAFLAGVFGRAA